MLKKICNELQKLCFAAKISIIICTLLSTLLILGAFFICLNDNFSAQILYIGEAMAKTSVKVFSVGIFFSLAGDFLVSAVDRAGK